MRPFVTEHNVESGIIETREMDDLELAAHQIEVEQAEARKNEAVARERNRQAILDRLGLTPEEAVLLLGR